MKESTGKREIRPPVKS